MENLLITDFNYNEPSKKIEVFIAAALRTNGVVVALLELETKERFVSLLSMVFCISAIL